MIVDPAVVHIVNSLVLACFGCDAVKLEEAQKRQDTTVTVGAEGVVMSVGERG
jgi:hypothetical protein